MQIRTIETPSLGDRSYVVTDGEFAAVIDPQRDLDRVRAVLEELDVRLVSVMETHVHNDYVTGGFALAREHGASYHVHAMDEVEFQRVPTNDGDEVKVGTLVLRAVHTPGHTPTHLSWVVNDGDRDVAVFTGGSMLYGSVGRTDLISSDSTDELTRAQFHSVRRLADLLDDDTQVHPTHGFGSFCSSGDTTGAERSTIGRERQENQALVVDDEQSFVDLLLAGLDDFPSYYAHMAPINRVGPTAADLAPLEVVDVAELRRRVHAGQWVVDLRPRAEFAAGHLRGSVNIELADSASTHLGWLVPWGAPLTLVADTAVAVEDMQRQLSRIGIDELAGKRDTGVRDVDSSELGHYRVVGFAELRQAFEEGQRPIVLDARRRLEWADGHLGGAVHIPLHQLGDRLDEVPRDGEVWVHCASGYRAAIAASLLARSGRQAVLIDGEFDVEAPRHFDVRVGT